MNNYPTPYPNRNRVSYKYRAINGTDVSVEKIGARWETVEQIKTRILHENLHSITPISEIDGVAVDLTEFLGHMRATALERILEAQEEIDQIEQEMIRRGAVKST